MKLCADRLSPAVVAEEAPWVHISAEEAGIQAEIPVAAGSLSGAHILVEVDSLEEKIRQVAHMEVGSRLGHSGFQTHCAFVCVALIQA